MGAIKAVKKIFKSASNDAEKIHAELSEQKKDFSSAWEKYGKLKKSKPKMLD
jgi:uncharacterized protein YukE